MTGTITRLRAILLFFLAILLMGITFPFLNSDVCAQEVTCVSGKCHASMGKEKTVHNPVKEGMCTICHQAVAEPSKRTTHPRNLSITLAQKGADLCYLCHEKKNTKKTVHGPVMGGDCITCHDPHQSPNKSMLRSPSPKLCFQCHPEDMMNRKVMHTPVVHMGCSTCHDNHQSDYPKRLVQEGNALCFLCHSDKQDEIIKKKTVHFPVKQSCVQCHDPHGSANRSLVTSPVPELCENCHPNEIADAKKALTQHSPMTSGTFCLNCHDVHTAGQPKLLRQQQKVLCLECHNAELKTKNGMIMNMKAYLQENKNGHGPVRTDDCTTCHNPHGSNFWRLLVGYYSPNFYTSYSDGKYGLCFLCHNKNAFTRRKTKKETDFRDGTKNLHYLHVNKRTKGRTCRACHEVHADRGQPKHVKGRVRFNGWSMPMNFVPTKNGGSCLPGCHGEKHYRR